jgi:hypothetical protein
MEPTDDLPFYLVGHVSPRGKWMALGPYPPEGICEAARGVATIRNHLTDDGRHPHLDIAVCRVAATPDVTDPEAATRRVKAALAKERKQARA